MTPSSFARAYVAHDLGGDLHRLAQRAAVVAAAVYVAGLAAGVVIHWANDWLSGDCRPWPVTWGAVAKPRPRLRDRYSKLIIKTETLEWLYKEFGRDNPSHPDHSLYTGLVQLRAAELVDFDQSIALGDIK